MAAEKFYPDYAALSSTEKAELVSSLQDIVRTAAHFCIYAGLGFLSFLTFVSYNKLKFKTRMFLMMAVCVLYSVSDEIHQNFVSGRSMQAVDVAVDFCGALTAVLLCSLFVAIVRPLRKKTRYLDPKKALVDLTNQLYEKLDDSLCLQKQMEREITQYKAMIEELNTPKKVEEQEQPEQEQPQTPEMPEDFNFAAAVIGKTVIEATKVCNQLSSNHSNTDVKELVNLVLGRTEVLKAEVLKILALSESLEQKKDLMQKEQCAAFDYFDSIKAQIS